MARVGRTAVHRVRAVKRVLAVAPYTREDSDIWLRRVRRNGQRSFAHTYFASDSRDASAMLRFRVDNCVVLFFDATAILWTFREVQIGDHFFGRRP
jgi:hypothetical protein